jgi:hypothetical protein
MIVNMDARLLGFINELTDSSNTILLGRKMTDGLSATHRKEFSMKVTIAFLSILMASGLTMVTMYNTLVDARSWGSDVPASIQTARDYYAHVDPRRFYLLVGPPTVLLSVLTMSLFWRDAVSLRLCFGVSAACYVVIVVLTILYFVPRDLILFRGPIQEQSVALRAAVGQWRGMNWVRTLLGCVGVLCSMRGIVLYYTLLMEKVVGR